MSTVGGYLEYRGRVMMHMGGGYLEYRGRVMMHMGGGYLEYRGRVMMHMGGYHEYSGGNQYHGGIPSFEI